MPMEVDITSSDGPRAHLVGGDLSHAEPRLAQEGCDESDGPHGFGNLS